MEELNQSVEAEAVVDLVLLGLDVSFRPSDSRAPCLAISSRVVWVDKVAEGEEPPPAR